MYSNPKGNTTHMMDKRKWRNGARIAAGFAGFVVSLAAAFFVATYISSGTHEGKTGSAGNIAQPVTITFGEGLTPTKPVEVTATVNNTSGGPRQWKSFELKIETPSVPICGQEWLQLRPEKTDGTTSEPWVNQFKGTNGSPLLPIPTGTQNIFAFNPTAGNTPKAVWLEFKPTLVGSTNQATCENVPVILNGKLTE
jgi:hypothetical protein